MIHFLNYYNINRMKALEITANLAEIQSRLSKYPYLSKNNLPGEPDGRVFLILESTKRFPDRKVNPNFYHWYILMKQFSQTTINRWINEELYHDNEDSLVHEFIKLYSTKKENINESTEINGSENRHNKLQHPSEVQYAIDISLKDYNAEKITNLRKLLEDYKAEMTEDESNSKYLRIHCRIDPVHLDEFSGKISKCIEFNELSLRKKDMKGGKSNVIVSQQKIQ